MIQVSASQSVEALAGKRILKILRMHRRVTFTSLADAMPDHPWNVLFQALNRLRQRQHVELVPLPLDYEVLLQPSNRATRDRGRRRDM
jgi:hypothetical protein